MTKNDKMTEERKTTKNDKMTEEERLKQYIEGLEKGSSNTPFKVPEQYFDTFCDRIMSQLPEQKSQLAEQKAQKAKVVRLIPHMWRMAAAAVVVVGLIVGSAILLPDSDASQKQMANGIQQSQTVKVSDEDGYLNDALDYAMVDNSEIEDYLTEN